MRGTSLDRKDRVHANRNLHFRTIDWIGFDMDYTLAIYRQDAMDTLSVKLTVERLIARGYPRYLAELAFDTRFPIRGLLVDKERGNVLKLDRHKYVTKGYHGMRQLTQAELDELYLHEKLLAHTKRYHWLDTLFSLCEVTCYVAVIDALEAHGHHYDPLRLFEDVRASIDQAHAEGDVYRHVTANLAEYIEFDPELARTLHKLRSSGKKLFVLTNSPFHYTDDVMRYLLPSTGHYQSWQQYFDVVICAAKKPGWFSGDTPLRVREPLPESEPERTLVRRAPASKQAGDSIDKGRVYEGGSLREFEEKLRIAGPRVLYVGDHIYGDILRSKKDTSWRTAFIVQELDQELDALERTADLRARRRQLAEARPALEDELRYVTARNKEFQRSLGKDTPLERGPGAELKSRADALREQLTLLEREHDRLGEEIDAQFHPYFGALLKDFDGMSLFGQQVDLYADVYTRRVSCLGAYSATQFFRSPHDLMPHEI